MGGGYSGNFSGTTGAIGDRQYYQVAILDELPVRTKANGISVGAAGGGGVVLETRMRRCFCCEEYTILLGTENEICPICGWIDDPYQNVHPDSLDGKNPLSLNKARQQYSEKRI